MTTAAIIEHCYAAWLSAPGRWSRDELAYLAAWTIAAVRGGDEWTPFTLGEC